MVKKKSSLQSNFSVEEKFNQINNNQTDFFKNSGCEGYGKFFPN